MTYWCLIGPDPLHRQHQILLALWISLATARTLLCAAQEGLAVHAAKLLLSIVMSGLHQRGLSHDPVREKKVTHTAWLIGADALDFRATPDQPEAGGYGDTMSGRPIAQITHTVFACYWHLRKEFGERVNHGGQLGAHFGPKFCQTENSCHSDSHFLN